MSLGGGIVMSARKSGLVTDAPEAEPPLATGSRRAAVVIIIDADDASGARMIDRP